MSINDPELLEYHRVREHLRRHHSAMIGRIDKSTLTRAGHRLGMLQGNTMYSANETEQTLFMDFAIYSVPTTGKSIVQRFVPKLPPPQDELDAQCRDAMLRARYSLYVVLEVKPRCCIYLHDRVRGGTLRAMDINLSMTLRRRTVIAGRLLQMPDYWMSSGATIAFTSELADVVQSRRDYPSATDAAAAETPIELSATAEASLAADAIRLAIEMEFTGFTRFR